MNLIRNAGFELGTLAHWEVDTAGVIAINAVEQRTGDYCVGVTSDGSAAVSIVNSDYVSVGLVQTIRAGGFCKSATARMGRLFVVEYDEGMAEITSNYVSSLAIEAGYIRFEGEYTVQSETAYIRLRFLIMNSAVGEVFYLDDFYVKVLAPAVDVYENKEIADVDDAGSSGNTSITPIDMRGYSRYTSDLRVSAVAGVNPTLDVTVKEIKADGRTIVVGTFAQATGTTDERIILTLPTGRRFYADYVIGGTNPVFSFELAITGAR